MSGSGSDCLDFGTRRARLKCGGGWPFLRHTASFLDVRADVRIGWLCVEPDRKPLGLPTSCDDAVVAVRPKELRRGGVSLR
ncbi:MAG: hypothetical protein BGO98_13960 [Myxococcales bacterium 68-20]|nr:MAG: hypothetical protein BGO98_13960 [Myxococcales bacterium 68-20]